MIFARACRRLQFWRPSFGDPVKLVEADASVRRPIFFRMGRFARLRVANQAMGQD